jgi:two-component system, NtrC family, sensor kinase
MFQSLALGSPTWVPPSPSQVRVLVVDDSVEDTELIVDLLARDGLSVTHRRVDRLEELRAALEQGPWDVVLSDYSMQELGVTETLAAVTTYDEFLPVIGVSGMAGEEVAALVMRAGARDFVPKDRPSRLPGAVRRESAGRSRRMAAREEIRINEVRLRQMQRMESLGQLAAGIAHEINTPLQYVDHNAEFLEAAFAALRPLLDWCAAGAHGAGAVSPEVRAMLAPVCPPNLDFTVNEIPTALASIRHGIEQAAKIIAAARKVSHPGEAERRDCDLGELIDAARTMTSNQWKSHAEVHVELHAPTVTAHCAPDAIIQVLVNLIVNSVHAIVQAKKSNPDRKGAIVISTRAHGSGINLRVGDNGCGIPPEHRSKVFELFFTTKPVGEGTGQGLAHAYATIVKRHGGAIEVGSEVGVGTEILIYLPHETLLPTAPTAAPPGAFSLPPL